MTPATPARLLFAGALVRRMPPWLQRLVGADVVGGMGDPIDALDTNTTAAVKARFPNATDEAALSRIGAERRIRRGLGESAVTYAARIIPWLDAHRTRGSAYALLGQLDAYFQDWLNVRMDIVDYHGNRHWIDAATLVADSVITRDTISWGGDSTGKWARFWLFFYLSADTIPSPIGGAHIVTDDGTFRVTDTGAFLVTDGELTASMLSADEIEMFTCVAREWSAAHVDQIQVVLLWGARRLWGYPLPAPTWAAWGGTSTWSDSPTVLTVLQ